MLNFWSFTRRRHVSVGGVNTRQAVGSFVAGPPHEPIGVTINVSPFGRDQIATLFRPLFPDNSCLSGEPHWAMTPLCLGHAVGFQRVRGSNPMPAGLSNAWQLLVGSEIRHVQLNKYIAPDELESAPSVETS